MSLLPLLVGIITCIPKYGIYKNFITIPFIGKEYIEAEIVNQKVATFTPPPLCFGWG